jgi:hypothetical protein
MKPPVFNEVIKREIKESEKIFPRKIFRPYNNFMRLNNNDEYNSNDYNTFRKDIIIIMIMV